MLQVDPDNRLSAEDLLRNAWLRDFKVNVRLEKVFEENSFGDYDGESTLTEDIEKTLENVVIDEVPHHAAKRQRIK